MTAESAAHRVYRVAFVIDVDEARLMAEAGDPFRPTVENIRWWTVGDLMTALECEIAEADLQAELEVTLDPLTESQ